MGRGQRTQTEVRNRFLAYCSCACVSFGTFAAANALQSSINIQNGIGNLAMATMFVSGTACAIFLSPLLIARFGAKNMLVLSQLSFTFFIAANFYPTRYTLVIAGIISGAGNAVMWPCTSLLNNYFGKLHAQKSKNDRSTDILVKRYTANFFAIFQFNVIFGNGISFIGFILSGKSDTHVEYNNTSITIKNNETLTHSHTLTVCGKYDCQDPQQTQQNLDNYTPNKFTLYVILSVLCVFNVVAVIVTFLVLPNMDDKFWSLEDGPNSKNKENLLGFDDTSKKKSKNTNFTCSAFTIKLRKTCQHLFSPTQLLVTGLTFYDGLIISFAMSELSRAFASCVLGVYKVTVGMILFGAGEVLFSYLIGKFNHRSGIMRNLPIFTSFCFDSFIYATCYLWEPAYESSWLIYVLFFALGSSDGFLQTLLNYRYSEYFPDRMEIAFTVWNMWIMIGIACQFAWSSRLCVSQKVVLQMAILAVSIVLYAFAEYKHLSTQKAKKLATSSDADRLSMQG